MDFYESEELKKYKKAHKKNLKTVLNELLQIFMTSKTVKSMNVPHEYVEFLKHIDFQIYLENIYPDLTASVTIGSKHGQIELKGPAYKVEAVLALIREKIQNISVIKLTPSQSSLIWNIVAKNTWNDYFARELGKENIKAKVCVGALQSLSVLASSSKECKRAFEILFKILRKDTLPVTKDCSVKSAEFQSLLSKLQHGNLVEIVPNNQENLIKFFGTDEAIMRATKEIDDFIDADRIRNETHRPEVPDHIWKFFARQVDNKSILQIAKDLEQFSVSIQLTEDHEQFILRGSKEGLVQCKQRLSEHVATIVEREKKLEFSGIKKFFLDLTGKEQLQTIKKEMCVDIEIVDSGKKVPNAPIPKPRMLSPLSKTADNRINEVPKFPIPKPRTSYLPSKTPEDCINEISKSPVNPPPTLSPESKKPEDCINEIPKVPIPKPRTLCPSSKTPEDCVNEIPKSPIPKPRTLLLPSKTPEDSINEISKSSLHSRPTLSPQSKTPEDCIYDICNFTTAEGVRVSWKHGRIENETADVLVNSARSNLNSPTECGRALMLRGGECYLAACELYKVIPVGDIVVTNSGNLSSEYVIHAVCCNLLRRKFKDGGEKIALEFIQGLVRRILEKCHELGASSLAMPMIGAGQHGFPKEVVLKVIKGEVNHISANKGAQLTLKDVRVIVFQPKGKAGSPQSAPLLNGPRFSTVSTSKGDEPNTSSTEPNTSSTDEPTISSTEITFGPVRMLLCEGNITKYEADALMNLSKTNVSTTTSKLASLHHTNDGIDSTPEEPIMPPAGTVLVTAASDSANITYYTHCVPISFDISGLESAIKASLDAAKFFELNSIIISATGMDTFNVSANECAKVILKASEIFSNAKYTMNIRVVVFRTDMMHIFKTAFEEKAKEQYTNVKFHESDRPAIGRKEEVIFRVVGFQDNMNLSIEKIEACFKRNKEKTSIKGERMVEDLRKHKSEIMELYKMYDVFITTSSEEIFIEGIGRQVFEFKDVLVDFLNEHEEKEREAKRLREISDSVQWSYADESGFVLFDEILNGRIETQFKAGNMKLAMARIENYEFDLAAKIIKDCRTGHTAQLVRKHVENTLDLPKFWGSQPKGQDVHLVELSSSSNEYQKVVDLLASAGDLMIVLSIQRIQNSRLYRLYLAKKESMGMAANEMQLFHGTKTENVSSINTNNFNRRFSGINGTRFGHGVYFARDASYSVRFSQKNSEDNNGLAHMYIAKVVVGKSMKGVPKMRVLSKRDDGSELFYDSAVDNTENPTIFVTFDDHQCYPEYLITFTGSIA